jgi:heme oxygenase
VNCQWRHEAAKEYLLQHAEEERVHWRWVLNDLAATGYMGSNPRAHPPHASCQAFLGLLYYISEEAPVARLAIAAVLEGIGARHGGTYGRKLLDALQLKPEQASFFLSHGETDKTHTVELRQAIAGCTLTLADWEWMKHAASAAGAFYRAIYDHDAYI